MDQNQLAQTRVLPLLQHVPTDLNDTGNDPQSSLVSAQVDPLGLQGQQRLRPRPPPLGVADHLDLVDHCHLVLLAEGSSLDCAAHEVGVFELFFLASDQGAIAQFLLVLPGQKS